MYYYYLLLLFTIIIYYYYYYIYIIHIQDLRLNDSLNDSAIPISVFNPLGLTFFQFFHPPTDSFEVIVHIDTQRPLQLCYTFAVCCTCAAFCLATLLCLIFTTVAKICLAVPVLTWCAVLLLMLRACSTEAQQGVGA